MSRTLFISDLHLAPSRPGVIRAFVHFLQTNTDCDSLYILGDLFDAWIGDDDDSSIANEVKQLLRDFSNAGPQLFLMQGNRDFLLGVDYCESVGAQLLADPTVIDLYSQSTLLMHGDSLCTDDVEYQAFRAMVRDPKWQNQILSQSLEERHALAGQLRSMSKESNSNKPEDIMDVNPEAVMIAMRSHGVQQLIHGHTHRPARHIEEAGTRWVLGDWDEKGWVLEVTPEEINLNMFDISIS